MGRGKIEIKRIENTSNRQVTFSKRRSGLFKKAKELAILCDAQVGVIVFSSTGKLFEFISPPLDWRFLIDKFQKQACMQGADFGARQQMMYEIARIKEENDKLEVFIRQYLGKDLAALTLTDLEEIEKNLQHSLGKVRNRKNIIGKFTVEVLVNQQTINLRRKEHILEDENNYLYSLMPDEKPGPSAMMDLFGDVYQNSSTVSELPAYRLQPMQPNLQHVSFQLSHGLQL